MTRKSTKFKPRAVHERTTSETAWYQNAPDGVPALKVVLIQEAEKSFSATLLPYFVQGVDLTADGAMKALITKIQLLAATNEGLTDLPLTPDRYYHFYKASRRLPIAQKNKTAHNWHRYHLLYLDDEIVRLVRSCRKCNKHQHVDMDTAIVSIADLREAGAFHAENLDKLFEQCVSTRP